MGHGTPLNVELRKKAYDLKNQGFGGAKKVAKKLGLKTDTVKTWFRKEPDWTPGTAAKGRMGAAFTHAETPANAYLHQLRGAMKRNLAKALPGYRSGGPGIAPEPESFPVRILRADQKFARDLGKSFGEQAAAKGVQLPEGHDWSDYIFPAAHQRGYEPGSMAVTPENRQDIMSRLGVSMLNEIPNYDPHKHGEFVPWFGKAINHAGRTAVDDFRKETAGQTRGNVRIDTPADDGGNGPNEPVYHPGNTGTPSREGVMLGVRKAWHNPKFKEARESIATRLGPVAADLFKGLLLGTTTPEELIADRATRQGGKKQADALWNKFESAVTPILRQHFNAAENPEDGHLLDAIETILGTQRMRENPMHFANESRPNGRGIS